LDAASRQGEGLGWGRGGKDGGEGEGREVEGMEREAPKLLLNQGPSIRDLLCHCVTSQILMLPVNIVFTM